MRATRLRVTGMMMKKFSALCCTLFLLASLRLHSAEYYVDNGNVAANDSNPGTLASPWRTIAKANQTLAAGDTVYIRQGTYTDYIAPARTGTAAGRITYRNYGSDSVTVTGNSYAIQLINKSYVTVDGIRFYLLDAFLDLEGASHNIIANCIFDQMRNRGQWYGSWIGASSQFNWIHHCVFSNFGYYTTDDIGAILDIGDEESTTDYSNYNLLENNTLFHGGHHVLGVFGRYNIVRNNYIHDENWYNGFGDRCVYLNGYDANSGFNLIEGNRIAFGGQPPDNTEAAGMNLITHSNIVRFNCFYGSTGSGVMMGVTANYYTGPQYNKVYHNTFYKNGQSTNPGSGAEELDGIGLANWGGINPVIGNVIKNNIFYGNPTSIGTYRVNLSDQVIAGNWQQAGDPHFVDIVSPFNPTNANVPNFQLQSNSPCIDQGVFLTSITSASGSGRTFGVADASYFIDGWGIVQGDLIQLQGTTQRAQITNVDYAARTVTVNSNLTWTQNQGVSLAYSGAGPDMGAFELGTGAPDTNLPPVVSAGPSQTINFPTNTAVLRGSATDPNHDPLIFTWSQVSGPASVQFSVINSSNTTVTATVPGAYVFRLTASDSRAAAYADTSVTFNPAPGALSFEAESGSLSGPFVVQSGYIVQNTLTGVTDGGRAAYAFTVTNTGNYIITGTVNAPDGGANSCYVNIDAEPADPTMIWDIPVTSGFEDRVVSWRGNGTLESPKVFYLTSGLHTMIVRGREAGLELDRFKISTAGETLPSLQILRVSGKVILSWPAWATNYTLETRSALSAQGTWGAVTNNVAISANGVVVTNNIDRSAAFYRLRKN